MHHNHRQYTRRDCILPTVDGRRIVYISVLMQSTVFHVQLLEENEQQQQQRYTVPSFLAEEWFFNVSRFGSHHALGVQQTKRNRIGEFENWTDESNEWNKWSKQIPKQFAESGSEKMHNVMALIECVVRWFAIDCWQLWVTHDVRHLNDFSSIGIHCKYIVNNEDEDSGSVWC